MFGSPESLSNHPPRYDQRANSLMGLVHIVTARYWLKFGHVARQSPAQARARTVASGDTQTDAEIARKAQPELGSRALGCSHQFNLAAMHRHDLSDDEKT